MELSVTDQLQGPDREAWLRLWNACPQAHPRQHPAMAELERHRGRQPKYLALRRGTELVAAGVLSIRQVFRRGPVVDGICLRGPLFLDLADGAEFLVRAISWARRHRVGRLRIAPFWRYPDAEQLAGIFAGAGFHSVPDNGGLSASTGTIDLSRDESQILSGLSSSARYQIRLAERMDVRVEPVGDQNCDREFFECFREMQAENGIVLSTWNEFAAMQSVFAAEPCLGVALEARRSGSFLGGLWVFRGPAWAVPTKFAVVRKQPGTTDQNVSIGPALFWRAMRWAKAVGCTMFDVDGYHPGLPPEHPCYAFCEFKKRLRPVHSILIREQFIVTSPVVNRIGSAVSLVARAKLHAAAALARNDESRPTPRQQFDVTAA